MLWTEYTVPGKRFRFEIPAQLHGLHLGRLYEEPFVNDLAFIKKKKKTQAVKTF